MTCAKAKVTCTIFPNWNQPVIHGENWCANPQAVCPRAPGEGYEKCDTICKQVGHAEVDAVRKACDAGVDLSGATAWVYGHYYACETCARVLRDAGVAEIRIQVNRAG